MIIFKRSKEQNLTKPEKNIYYLTECMKPTGLLKHLAHQCVFKDLTTNLT